MRSLLSTFTILLYATISLAQIENITVNNTDPSIVYEGKADPAPLCKQNPDGTLVGGQAGCYLLPDNCGENVSMAQNDLAAAATFKFRGTAISIISARSSNSPLYTVTLDGESTDVDGAEGSVNGAFQCTTPLFSKEGLDPNTEHTIRLATKGNSPSAGMNRTDGPGFWSLVSFVYTPSLGNENPSRSGSSTSVSASDSTLPKITSSTDAPVPSSSTPDPSNSGDKISNSLSLVLVFIINVIFAFAL